MVCEKDGHERQLEYFCEPCEELLCPDCMVFDQKHVGQGHAIVSIVKRHKQERANLLGKVHTEFDQVIKQLKDLQSHTQSQKSEMEEQKSKVTVEFNLAVFKRRQAMTKTLEDPIDQLKRKQEAIEKKVKLMEKRKKEIEDEINKTTPTTEMEEFGKLQKMIKAEAEEADQFRIQQEANEDKTACDQSKSISSALVSHFKLDTKTFVIDNPKLFENRQEQFTLGGQNFALEYKFES